MAIPEQTLNRLRVLKEIRRRAPISRSELPGATGLSGGTITQLSADLVRRGLLVERRDAASRPGRPRTLLEIASASAVVVGASLHDRGVLTTTFVDLAGRRLFSIDTTFAKPPTTLDDFGSGIGDALEAAIAASPFAAAAISRVGVALPAVVDRDRGVVHFVVSLPVGEVPLAAILGNRLGLPVTIEHDMTSMARAEHWFGRAQQLDSFTLVHVGFSVGSAEYADGVPKSGTTGLNSELGHVKTAFGPAARPCLCGARGCLMAYSSMYGILEQTELLAGASFPPTGSIDARFARLLDRADHGDARSLELLEQAGRHLGMAIANHLNATATRHVLLSVLSARLLERLRPIFLATLRANVMPGVLEATNLEFVLTDPDWRWKGIAALGLEQTYLDAGEAAPSSRQSA